MPQALPNPRVEFMNGKSMVKLIETLSCPEETVPCGFTSDGLSGNWLVHLLFPRFDSDTLTAAIIHDWCYGGYLSRLEADKLLVTNLLRLRVPKWKRWVIYAGVRIGGKGHYSRRRDEGNVGRCKG